MTEEGSTVQMIERKYSSSIEKCVFNPGALIVEAFVHATYRDDLLVLVDGDRGALGCVLVELIVRDDSIEESHIQLIPIVCFFCKIHDHRYQGKNDQLTDEGKSFGN